MLLDTNIIIYATKPEFNYLRKFIATKNPSVSAISYLEILEYPHLTLTDKYEFTDFFDASHIIPISQMILEQAMKLQKIRKISLSDAIISATALLFDLYLVTANVRDFEWLDKIKLINPILPESIDGMFS